MRCLQHEEDTLAPLAELPPVLKGSGDTGPIRQALSSEPFSTEVGDRLISRLIVVTDDPS